MDLSDAALRALWATTHTTLGDVMLATIADRVVHITVRAYPVLATLSVQANGRIDVGALRGEIGTLHHQRLVEGMRFVLVEFLTVIGVLTDEVLTPELHAALNRVAVVRASSDERRHGGILPRKSESREPS